MKTSVVMALLLLVGVVDKIEEDVALIEYEKHGKIYHTHVSLSQSACQPVEGQKVHFFEDYKIIACMEDEEYGESR